MASSMNLWGALLVHVVEDAAADAHLAFDGGDFLFGGALETEERDGHADAVALHNGLLALDFHHLTVGLLAVDADDGANLYLANRIVRSVSANRIIRNDPISVSFGLFG